MVGLRGGSSSNKYQSIQEPITQLNINQQLDAENTENTGKSTITASTFNLAKNIIGGGMLALPAGMAAGGGTGLIPAFALVLSTCILSAYTFVLLGKSVQYTKAASFKDLWAKTIGSHSAWVIDAAIFAICFGVCTVYGCFLGDIFSSLASLFPSLPTFIASRTGSIIGITGLVLLPLCLLRDLSALKYSSMAGIGAVIYVTGFIVKRCFDGTYAIGSGRLLKGLDLAMQPKKAMGGLFTAGSGTFVLFNMLCTAFMAHPNAVIFYRDLERADAKRFAKVAFPAFGLAALIYGLVMACGYLTFGLSSSGLILNNYHKKDDILAVLGRLGTGISIIGSQPLLFSGLRESAFSTFTTLKLFPKDINSKPVLWTVASITLLTAATILAILTPNVAVIVSLVGAVLGAGMVYSLPAYMYLNVLRQKKREGITLKNSLVSIIGLHLVVLFGFIMTILGTGLTLLEIRR